MAAAPLLASTRFFGRFLGRTIGEAAAFSAGVAIGPVLGPIVQEERNQVNAKYPFKPLDLGDLAEIVAEDVKQKPWGEGEAAKTGFDPTNFDALLGAVLNAPGFAELLTLWRRDGITDEGFVHGLRKARLEGRWDAPLKTLKTDRLDPSTMAVAIQRRVIEDPGYLIQPPPIAGSNVPPMPVSSLNADDEAKAHGVDPDRLAVLTRIVGLPPAPGELLQLLNRGEINEDAFNLGVVEGNTRQEWAPYLVKLRRRLLSPTEYAELDLRGWITSAERDAGAALSGLEPEDADLLFKLHGRPITVHQITTGLARGGKFDAGSTGIPEAYLRSLQQGSERPEWYSLSYANRYNLPSPFVMRGLAQTGVWDAAKTEERLLWAGWIPEDAKETAAAWTKAKSGATKEATVADLLALYDGRKADTAETLTALEALGYPADEARAKVDVLDARRVSSARNTAISDLHAKYKKDALPEANVATALRSLGVAEWAVPEIIAAWRTFLTAEAETAPTQLPPSLTSFAPASGPIGAAVTLTGTNLQGATTVWLGTTTTTFTVTSATEISATVPTGATSGQWAVRTPGGAATTAAAFLVT